MKTNKRILSLIVTLLFVLTSCISLPATIAGAAGFNDVPGTSPYYQAITELVERGVINGYEDGSFKPNNTITRAEFSKLLAVSSAPAGTLFTATTTQFPDVADSSSPSAWAIPYISYAVGVKAINGYEDGTFRPTNTVTYGEAVKMIVCTLGYEPVIDKTLTPWYQGYIDVANQIGLTQNAVSMGDNPANRGLVAQLINNMLGCSPLIQTGVDINGNPIYSNTGSGSFDEEKDNATEEEDVLYGFIEYNLTGDEIKRNEVKIGDETYGLGDYTADDLKAYLGKMVTFKYNAKNTLTSVKLASGYNQEIVVDASQIASVSNTALQYYKNELDEINDETTTISMPSLYVVYNGVPVDPAHIGNGFNIASYLNVADGKITFISNDGNARNAEVAFVESYKTYFANTPSTLNGVTTLYDQFPAQSGNTSALVLDEDEVASVQKVSTKGGKPANAQLKSIAKGNVVSVALPYASTGTDAIVVYSAATVTGQVSEMDTDYSYIKIGNIEYEISPYFERLVSQGVNTTFTANDSGKFYLDRLGRIVYFEKNESSNPYALAVRYKEMGGIDAQYGIDLYISGTAGTKFFPLRENVKVNGNTTTAFEAITHLINNCPTYAQNAHIGNGKYILQPIKYETRQNDQTGEIEISSIECMDSTDDYADSMVVPYAFENTINATPEYFANGGRVTYAKSGYTFKKDSSIQFTLRPTSVVFAIPQDITNVNAYRKYSYTSFVDGTSYVVEPYDVEKQVASAALYYLQAGQSTQASVSTSTPAYLVESINPAYDENNNEVIKVVAYKAGETTLPAKPYYTSPGTTVAGLDSIQAGDVVKFAFAEGKIAAVKTVYASGSLTTQTAPVKNGNANHISQSYDGRTDWYQAIKGIVYNVEDSIKTINIIPYALSDGSFSPDARIAFEYASDVKYYKLGANGKFTAGDASIITIADYETFADTNPQLSSEVVAIVMDKKVVAVYILN